MTMIDKGFINSTFAYEVSIADMDQFLKECEDLGFVWRFTKQPPTEFNPFIVYEGDKIKYLMPVMDVKNTNKIYVLCFDNMLTFSFCREWYMPSVRRFGNTSKGYNTQV